jgi:hypothetical protein
VGKGPQLLAPRRKLWSTLAKLGALLAKKRKGNMVEWKVSVPAELALHIEYLLFDPSTQEPEYGARSRLVTKLLEAYWKSIPDAQRRKILLGEASAEASS